MSIIRRNAMTCEHWRHTFDRCRVGTKLKWFQLSRFCSRCTADLKDCHRGRPEYSSYPGKTGIIRHRIPDLRPALISTANIPILPSRILDFCKQKLWPLLCIQKTTWHMLAMTHWHFATALLNCIQLTVANQMRAGSPRHFRHMSWEVGHVEWQLKKPPRPLLEGPNSPAHQLELQPTPP